MYLWYQPSVFIIVRSCRILERRETIYGWNIRDCMGCAFWLQVLSCFTGRVGERKTGLFRSRAIRVSFSSDTFSKSLCGSERLVYYHKVAICSLRNASSFSIRFCFHCRSAFTSERLTFFFCSDWFSSCSFFLLDSAAGTNHPLSDVVVTRGHPLSSLVILIDYLAERICLSIAGYRLSL